MEKFQAPAHGKQSLLFNISNIVSIPVIPYRYTLSEHTTFMIYHFQLIFVKHYKMYKLLFG